MALTCSIDLFIGYFCVLKAINGVGGNIKN